MTEDINDEDRSLRLLSIKEILKRVGIGRTLLYEEISLGRLKTVTIGRRRFVTAQALNDYISLLPSRASSNNFQNVGI